MEPAKTKSGSIGHAEVEEALLLFHITRLVFRI